MQDFIIKLTKCVKLFEVNNCMCHNYYYLQYGRIYNANRTEYRHFKFVVWFDIFDVMEYFDKDIITKENINEYAKIICGVNCESYGNTIKIYNDCKQFFDFCNNTINHYNMVCY